jgi:hypothetical protein
MAALMQSSANSAVMSKNTKAFSLSLKSAKYLINKGAKNVICHRITWITLTYVSIDFSCDEKFLYKNREDNAKR